MDKPINVQNYPGDYFNIMTKKGLLSKIYELEDLRKFDDIHTLIRFYCIPMKEVRESFMQDILLLLAIQVYEHYNCSKD